MVQINLRLSKAFLEDIDATWEEQGFNSRSEFLRYAARDAIKHPAFSREGWKQIAASEHDLRSGDAAFVSRDEALENLDYPTTTDELVKAYGDYEIETQGGEEPLDEVLSSTENQTYDSADDVRNRLLGLIHR